MRPQPSDYKDLEPNQNDRSVKIVDGALKIDNIQKSHEGYYICKASNGIGGISAVAKISVQGNSFEIRTSSSYTNFTSIILETNIVR